MLFTSKRNAHLYFWPCEAQLTVFSVCVHEVPAQSQPPQRDYRSKRPWVYSFLPCSDLGGFEAPVDTDRHHPPP